MDSYRKPRGAAAGPRGLRWRLKSFGRATLVDVFSQVRIPGDFHSGNSSGRKGVASDQIHTPYSRLKEALQSGRLRSVWGKRGDDDFEEIPPEYWRVKFDAAASPKKQPSSNRHEPVLVQSTARPLLYCKSTKTHCDTVISSPPQVLIIAFNELEDLPELGLAETSSSRNQEALREEVAPYDENRAVFVQREEVILAEQEISQIEYKHSDWSLGQTLGWVAYQRREKFRSLWETDLNPRPNYCGEIYSSGFVTDDPVWVLREVLLSGKLIGRVGGATISPAKWLDLDVWAVRRLKFLRAEVVQVWPELPPSPVPEGPPPSDKEMSAIHEELDSELGKLSPEQKFRDRLKELGHNVTVSSVRAFRHSYAKAKGIEFKVGPRGPRKPSPILKAVPKNRDENHDANCDGNSGPHNFTNRQSSFSRSECSKQEPQPDLRLAREGGLQVSTGVNQVGLEVLSPDAAARRVGLSLSMLAKMRCLGGGPAYLKLGRAVRYRQDDLDAWLAARRVRSTSDAERLPSRLTDALP